MVCATLQELSGDRFLLGLAAGAADVLGWAGIARDAPLRRTAEAVVAIRALCDGGAPADTADDGSRWQPDGATPRARPSHADLPRCDVAPHAPTRRVAGRRSAPPAVPAGVVRRGDGEHRRRAPPRAGRDARRHRRGGVRVGVDRRRPGRRRSTPGRQARVLRPVVLADRPRPCRRGGCRPGPPTVARSGRRGARPAGGDDVARHQRLARCGRGALPRPASPPGPVTCRSARRSATIAGWPSACSPSTSSPPSVAGTTRTCASLPRVEDRCMVSRAVTRVLVANRGEIAVRVVRACHQTRRRRGRRPQRARRRVDGRRTGRRRGRPRRRHTRRDLPRHRPGRRRRPVVGLRCGPPGLRLPGRERGLRRRGRRRPASRGSGRQRRSSR